MELLNQICKNRKAVSRGIILIIVAVAIVASVAVGGWMMGLGGPTTPGTKTTTTTGTTTTTTTPPATQGEALTISKESSLTAGRRLYTLLLTNTGTVDINITRIQIGGFDVTTMRSGAIVKFPVPLKTGTQIPVIGTASGSVVEGESYELKITTASGKVYSGTLTATKEEEVG